MSYHFICLVVVISVGLGAYRSNPHRLLNQAIALCSAVVAVWLYLFWVVTRPGLSDPVPWLKAISAFGSLFPWVIWWVGRCAIRPESRWRDMFMAGRYWLLYALLMGALAASDWFIPPESTREHPLRGPAYTVHALGLTLALSGLVVHALIQVRRLGGERRVAVKTLLMGGALTGLVGVSVTVLPSLLGLPNLAVLAPVAVLVFYVLAAWGIISRKILDARHQLLTILRRAAVLVSASVLLTWWLSTPTQVLPPDVKIFLGVAGCVAYLMLFEQWSGVVMDRAFGGGAPDAVRSLRRFASDVHALPAAELMREGAKRIAEVTDCGKVALFWRNSRAERLRLISSHPDGGAMPDSIQDAHWLVHWSMQERAPWRISRGSGRKEQWLEDCEICLPVLDGDAVLFLALIGRKKCLLGYSEGEVSALQALAAGCNHTLTTRALLEQENERRELVYSGKVAAGMAHNIRNPLAVVRAFLEADPALPADLHRELHQVARDELARIQATIDGLSALSRGELFALARHDIHALVARAVNLQESYLRECRATVDMHIPPGEHFVLAEPSQFVTALNNLLRNAGEELAKLPSGGRVQLTIMEDRPGMVTLRIADTGRGLPAAIQEAIFTRDLFARTTKGTSEPGRRTGYGIGLHSTMLIVTTGHGGEFEYDKPAFYIRLKAA